MIKISSKTLEKDGNRQNFGVFLLNSLKTYILTGKFNSEMDTIRTLFSKIRALFSIFKKGQGKPPIFSLVAHQQGYFLVILFLNGWFFRTNKFKNKLLG